MKFLKSILIVLMVFCFSKPFAQDNLDFTWSVWNDTANYELSDSFYHYLTFLTSYDTLVLMN